MNKTVQFIATMALMALIPLKCLGWGKTGHGIVAEISFIYLDKASQDSVKKYLGNTTIEQASTWMDEMRSDHSYDYMKPWHYVNIEKGGEYKATKEDNIVNAINTAISNLEHRVTLSNEEIKKNLMVLFHLVGDLHMPLHIGYPNDKGGNDVRLNYLGKPTNLHWVWDSEMIESEKITIDNCLMLYKNYTREELEKLKVINVEKWIKQPRFFLDQVYALPDGGNIDQPYVTKNKDIVEQQLLFAGIRLASVLGHIFGNK